MGKPRPAACQTRIFNYVALSQSFSFKEVILAASSWIEGPWTYFQLQYENFIFYILCNTVQATFVACILLLAMANLILIIYYLVEAKYNNCQLPRQLCRWRQVLLATYVTLKGLPGESEASPCRVSPLAVNVFGIYFICAFLHFPKPLTKPCFRRVVKKENHVKTLQPTGYNRLRNTLFVVQLPIKYLTESYWFSTNKLGFHLALAL